MDRYADREVYRSLSNARDLRYFRVTVEQTDLLIGAARVYEAEAKKAVEDARTAVKAAIAARPEFQTSLTPLSPLGGEMPLILSMLEAGRIAGTGPMASVAGAIAEAVGRALLPRSPNVVVENGGDVYLLGPHSRTVAIAAGKSPVSGRLGIRLRPGNGIALCTSSGTYGHSLSFGKADAAVAVAGDGALADAVATMLGNRCLSCDDLAPAAEWAASLPGMLGAVAVMGDAIAAAGNIELTVIGE